MRIIHKDLSKGEIKLKIETLDDLWHLSQILEPDDILYSVTYRRQQSKSDMVRSTKTEKVRVFMGIRVEKMDFSHYSDSLRVTGVILEGDQTGSYHTINIEVNSTPKIVKQWKKYQLERITTAVNATQEPQILIVVMDEGESDFGIVKQYGIDFAVSINRNIPGKRDTSLRKTEKEGFFKDVAEKISSYLNEMNISLAIVAGPGFVKEEFYAWVRENKKALAPKLNLKGVSVTGKTGIWEVVKRGYVEDIYAENQVAKEIAIVETFFRKILTDDSVYGYEEVKMAISNSQVDNLIVTDELLRTSEKVQKLLEHAKNLGATPHIISTSHEGGDKLSAIGGIGATLRFKLTY